MKIWKFEIKKLWRRRQFLILALLAIICVATIFFRNYWSQDEIVDRAFQSMASHSSSVFQIIDYYNNEMTLRSENDTLDDVFIAGHENAQLMSNRFNEWQSDVRTEDWNRVPESELAFIQTVLQHIEYGGIYPGYSDDQLQQSLKRNQILLENELPYEDELYSITIPNFMKVVFLFLLSIPTLGFLVLLFGDVMVAEKFQHTIRTLSTQPIKKWQLLFGKFMGQLSTVVFTLLIIILASFAIPVFFGGHIGSLSYPQLIYVNDGFEFISIGHYLFLYIFLFLGAASFLFSLVLLFSTFFNDRLSVLFFTLLALFGGVALTNHFAPLQSVVNPFYYFQFQQLIEFREQLGHPLFIFVPYVTAIFIVMISALLMKQRHTATKGEKDSLPFKNGAVSKKKNLFPNVSKFESRKFRREGMIKRFTIIILLLIVTGYIYLSFSTNQLHDQFFSQSEASISALNEVISMDKQKIENSEKIIENLEKKDSPLTASEEALKRRAEADLLGYSDGVIRYSNDLERKKQELTAYQQGDWKTVYEGWIEEITNWWKHPRYHSNLPTKQLELGGGLSGLSDFTFLASIQEKEWMMEHHLEPVLTNFNIPYTWTIYDEFISPIEQLKWDQDTRKLSDTGLFYVYTFFSTPSYLVLFALLVFLLGAGLTAEKGDRRTLAFLQTQPLRKSTIFLSKTWISMLLAVAITIISILSMVIIGTIVNRVGDWKFPVLHYDAPSIVDAENYNGFVAAEGGFHFMYMGEYLLETGGLFLASLIFLIALSIFFSLFFKNTMSSLLTTLIVAFSGYFLSTLASISTFAHWLPFTYLNVGKIANGEMATVLENEVITTTTGIISLLVGAIFFISIGLVYVRSRWMKVV